MNTFLKFKFVPVMLWLLLFLMLHGLMMRHELYGQNEGVSGGIYEMDLSSPDLMDAVLEVKAFFKALSEGKVDLLGGMMEESLREEYRLSLNDPSYPSLLKQIYGGSEMVIKRIDRNEDGSFEIDAQLISPKYDITEVRFELGKSYSMKAFVVKY